MKILLMRHALTESRAEAGVDFDAERPVSDVGKKHINQVNNFLKSLNISVSKAVASPFRRCIETAELLMGNREGVELKASPALVPGAGTDELLHALANNFPDHDENDWILAVCHEPDISYILGRLAQCPNGFPISVYPGDIFALDIKIDCQHAIAEVAASLSPIKISSCYVLGDNK